MFTVWCSSDGCRAEALERQEYCAACYDTAGYPAGWSRSRDDAWLAYVDCEGISRIPVPLGATRAGIAKAVAEMSGKSTRQGK